MKKLPEGFYLGKTKGFTIIDLLVVIVIVTTLLVGVWVALDPIDKIKSSSDAKIQTDIESLARAEETYSTYYGYYTNGDSAQNDLVNVGELKSVLVPPNGYGSSYVFAVPAAPLPICDVSGSSNCTSVVVCGQLKSKKYASATLGKHKVWLYSSVSGQVCAFDNEDGPDDCTGLSPTLQCP